MCRWIVYFGNDVTVSDAIVKHGHGLVQVASAEIYAPRLEDEHLYDKNDITINFDENGDGFGIGFYPSDRTLLFPGVLRDCKPIWHSNNLGPVAESVKSSLVFGHVRKSFEKGSISEQNCHPFKYGVYMFMHNGSISKFHKIRGSVLMLISEIFDSVCKDHDLEKGIEGTTDSEALFFLVLACIAKLKGSIDFSKPNCTVEELSKCLQEAISLVLDLVNKKVGKVGFGSRLNLAFADGEKIVVTRFRNSMKPPPSLYYALRQENAKTLRSERVLSLDDFKEIGEVGRCDSRMSETFGFSLLVLPEVIMIASEPTSKEDEMHWKLVPQNNIIMVSRNRGGGLIVKDELMEISRDLYQVPDENVCASDR